jgi:hypothetical protein
LSILKRRKQLEVSGIPSTDAGKDARAAMEHRKYEAERTKKLILKEIIDGIQVQMAGGGSIWRHAS